MKEAQSRSKNIFRKAGNFLLIGLILLMVINPDAKSWVLQQLVSVGLFKAEINEGQKALTGSGAVADFRFVEDGGKTISISELRGKVVFINFWATWCPPCRAEMPSLNALYQQLKNDDRFVFVFINEDDDISKAGTYLKDKGYDMPVMTRSGTVPPDIFSGTLPTTIVLNKAGELVMKHEGLANYNTENFKEQLYKLL